MTVEWVCRIPYSAMLEVYEALCTAQYERLADANDLGVVLSCTCYPDDRCPPCATHDALVRIHSWLLFNRGTILGSESQLSNKEEQSES